MLDVGIAFAEHVDLLMIDTPGFELVFDPFQVFEVVADVVVPLHGTPPIWLAPGPHRPIPPVPAAGGLSGSVA
ncbi:hypothetical protein D3C85_1542110 [compost metagenome]